MTIISQVAQGMRSVLTTIADTAGEVSGFIKRKRKLTGSLFVQAVVLTWLSNPEATYSEMSQTASVLGVEISPQAIEQRFNSKAAEMMKQVLDSTVEKMISGRSKALPILERFDEVFIDDSSWISLPPELADIYKGSSSDKEKKASSAKLQLRWELVGGGLVHLFLTNGTTHDCSAAKEFIPLACGSLRISDLGYFSLEELAQDSEDGVFWLNRLKANCHIFDEEANRIDMAKYLSKQKGDCVDIPILLGASDQLPARLLALRVPDDVAAKRRREIRKEAKKKGETPSKKRLALADWNLLVTNVDAQRLTASEAMTLMRVRWQIELMFKLWKSHGKIDASTSTKPMRILTELYAKLIAMVIQHWILLTSGFRATERSFYKAAKAVGKQAMSLAAAFYSKKITHLMRVLFSIGRALSTGCRIYKRRSRPSTYQRLLQSSYDSPLLA